MSDKREDNKYTYQEQSIWDQLWGKSVNELNIIFRSAMIKATDINAGPNEQTNEKRKCDIIGDILTEKKRRDESKESVREVYTNIIEKSYYNLLAAYTLTGQIVISILEEEDGQSSEQIRSWYEELMQLEDNEYSKLLDDLETDGTIYKADGKYYFLRACEENLSFDNHDRFIEWIKKCLRFTEYSNKWTILSNIKEFKEIFYYIPLDKPFYKEELYSRIDKEKETYDHRKIEKPDSLNKFYKNIDKGNILSLYRESRRIIDGLVDDGFLKQHESYYYVPLIGEN